MNLSLASRRVLPGLWIVFFAACATPKHREAPYTLGVNRSAEQRAQYDSTGKEWIVSTQGKAATDAANRILGAGGNIIDAAVAASFTIGVERPHSTGLGGGGFLIYREAKTGKVYVADFRERGPKNAREKMYLDLKGEPVPERSQEGKLAIAVPGLVKGLAEIHRRFGRAKWSDLLQPAIELAEGGLEVYPTLSEALEGTRPVLARFEDSKRIFLHADGSAYAVGEKIVQKDLAGSLRKIAANGEREFYRGSISREILRATRGWLQASDLRSYRVKWREPVRSTFRNYEVISMPPPSSGGTHVIQILSMLENDPLETMGPQSAAFLHLEASAMQRAFLERARYMGDPDFVKVPVARLLSKKHAAELRATIDPAHATPADALEKIVPPFPEHTDTTHISIMDREGNVVVTTQTINGWFGSGIVAGSSGILLNNEMDDFSAKPGASNLFGAIGSKANAVRPGKTPLSSMSPTIVLEDGRPRLALGAPGGTRIITCVAQTILNALVFRMPLYDAIAATRIHEQWRPDELRIESPGLAEDTERALAAKGWKIAKGKSGCAVMAVAREGTVLHGVSEPRDFGKAAGR